MSSLGRTLRAALLMGAPALPGGCSFPEYGFDGSTTTGGTHSIGGGQGGDGGEEPTGGNLSGGTGGESGSDTGGSGGSTGGLSPGGTGGTVDEPTCDDEVRNGDETDVDCGGPDCAACVNGRTCQANEDCWSQRCSSLGRCQPGLVVMCRCIENCDHTALTVSKMEVRFENRSTDAISLEDITLRYYYNEPSLEVEATCASSELPGGCEAITKTQDTWTPPSLNTSHVLELQFSAISGEVASGSSSASGITYIEVRAPQGSSVRQLDHYSFYERATSGQDPPTNFVECSRITLHRSNGVAGGVLVWGTPPPPID